jgi:hypothetical protein
MLQISNPLGLSWGWQMLTYALWHVMVVCAKWCGYLKVIASGTKPERYTILEK